MGERSSYEHLAGGRFGVRYLSEAPDGATVVCFPHAGGQSLAFRELARHLSGHAVAAVDPPGHGWSSSEPLANVDALAALYEDCLPDASSRQVVLLGHSMGGYVVTALAHRLARRGRAPMAVIISAARPPHRRASFRSLAEFPDDVLVEAVGDISDAPAHLLTRFLPAIRADFRAFENWNPPRERAEIPTLVLGGTSDPFCPPHHVLEWDRYYSRCQFRWVEGAHLFLESRPEQSAEHVRAFLRAIG